MLKVRQKRRKNIWPSLKLKEVIIMRVRAEALIKSVVTVLGVLERDGPSLTKDASLRGSLACISLGQAIVK